MLFLPLVFQSTKVLAMCLSSVRLILLGNVERNITLDEIIVKKPKTTFPNTPQKKTLMVLLFCRGFIVKFHFSDSRHHD